MCLLGNGIATRMQTPRFKSRTHRHVINRQRWSLRRRVCTDERMFKATGQQKAGDLEINGISIYELGII